MALFEISFRNTGKNEGGIADDPLDPGGLTYCGLTEKDNPLWGGWPIIKNHMPLYHGQIIKDKYLDSLVMAQYKEKYWDAVGGLDQMQSQELANQVYDSAVNFGVGVAKQLLNQSK